MIRKVGERLERKDGVFLLVLLGEEGYVDMELGGVMKKEDEEMNERV